MLGTRTKQVYSYGRRNQRIVNVSEERDRPKKESISIFDDLEPVSQWVPIASKMRKRENTVPLKSKSPSPKVVRVNRKKRLSPVLQSAKKRTRVAQIINAEVHKPTAVRSKPKDLASKIAASKIDTTPPRTPLAPFSLNALGSPAIAGKLRGTRVEPTRGTPPRLNKPFSPFVDVDIIVLDDDGNTVKQERRVSRTDIEINPINRAFSKQTTNLFARKKRDQAVPRFSDSDTENSGQPTRLKRLARRAPTVIYSDDDDDDPVSLTQPQEHPPTHKPRPFTPPSNTEPPSADVGVALPPPYPTYPNSMPNPRSAPSRSAAPSLVSQLSAPPAQALPTRYQQMPSPATRPRQLTPIRGGRGKSLFHPPSPSDTADLDLSLDWEELSIDSSLLVDAPSYPEPEFPEHLRPLLEECHQEICGPIDFSSFIDTFPYDPVVQSGTSQSLDSKFRKIGEASYSEVFGIGNVVLKVIPLRDEAKKDNAANNGRLRMNARYNENTEEEDGPAPSDAKDVRKEIIVTRAMGEVCDGFVKLLKAYIVRGRYPEVLLKLWDDYSEKKGSESARPDKFPVSQVYTIIVLPNGGPDLEAYKFINASKVGWRQACSLFWQVAKSLAHAEQLVSFEHRDLHWGQVLVKNLPISAPTPLKTLNQNQKSKPKSFRLPMDDLAHGVRATLIDLGLSRMDAGDGAGGEKVHWTPFEDEVFMGEGDYQFDVYRSMRDYNGGAWEDFNPLTNVMWLHYLTIKLLDSKRLKAPVIPRKARTTDPPPAATVAFSEQDCYDCLVDVEEWLCKCINGLSSLQVKTVKGKGRRPKVPTAVTPAVLAGPSCAGEVVAYAVKKGWVKSTS